MAQNLIKQTNQKFNPARLTTKVCAVMKLQTHLDVEIKEKEKSSSWERGNQFSIKIKASS